MELILSSQINTAALSKRFIRSFRDVSGNIAKPIFCEISWTQHPKRFKRTSINMCVLFWMLPVFLLHVLFWPKLLLCLGKRRIRLCVSWTQASDLPERYRKRLRTINSVERLNEEIRRRERFVSFRTVNLPLDSLVPCS